MDRKLYLQGKWHADISTFVIEFELLSSPITRILWICSVMLLVLLKYTLTVALDDPVIYSIIRSTSGLNIIFRGAIGWLNLKTSSTVKKKIEHSFVRLSNTKIKFNTSSIKLDIIKDQGVRSLTFRELTKINSRNLAPVITFMVRISSWNFARVPKAWLLGTRIKFQLGILMRTAISAIHTFRDDILESSRNFSKTAPRDSDWSFLRCC